MCKRDGRQKKLTIYHNYDTNMTQPEGGIYYANNNADKRFKEDK